MKRFIFCILSLIVCVHARGQVERIAFWNLENMFDTIHAQGKRDAEFTPNSERKWNSYRYWKKLRGITQTIAAMDFPVVVGLCEVENDTVLRDLTCRTALRHQHYSHIITDSPDERGINTAMIYKSSLFRPISWNAVRVQSIESGLRPTRDILLVEALMHEKDTLYIAVVHFPSRQNNTSISERGRMLAAETLRHIADSLKDKRLIVMGDFNAEPRDKVFQKLLPPLYSLMPQDRKTLRSQRGSYYFQREWGYLDHILVSEPVLPYVYERASECRFPFLLRTEKRIPWRTYGGTAYLGGLSDHLPVIFKLFIQPESPKTE